MSSQPWTKAQAENNIKFQAKLDKITRYLVKGDWHGSYVSRVAVDGDIITNFIGTKENLPFVTLEFTRLQNGALKAESTYENSAGDLFTEEYIVGVQPSQNSFYMVSIQDNDVVLGDVSRRSGVLGLTVLEQLESGDRAIVAIMQYTNLADL
jgi:hypothetical protein